MVKMKDSGIEWIGEIPETWGKVKFNAIYSNRNTKVSDREYAPLSVTKKGIIPQLATAAKTNDNDNRKLVKSGDFVINSRSDRRGSCGISSLDGSVSLINTVLEPKNSQMEPLYFDFLFHTIQFADEFYKWGHGIVDDLWTTNWNDMKNITLILPTRSEQQLIANYLDNKTTEIDGLIDKINAEIDLLERYKHAVISNAVTIGIDSNSKLKTSNVDYIPILNSNWRITKLGYICNKLMRPFNSTDTALICSNQGKVIERPDSASGIMVSGDNAMQGIKNGDIAIHGMDTWHGAIALSNKNGKITRVVHVCESIEDNRFIVYYLQHLAFQGVYKLISNGVRGNTSDFRSWEKVKNIYISIPEFMQEQVRICDYLDELTSKIDKNINQKQQQINQLTEYKNSLIFEYVTGKKQVKEAN